MLSSIILLFFLNISVISCLNTSLSFKYSNIQYEETNEVQILSLSNRTINYIVIKNENDDNEGIFRLGIKQKYKNYCENEKKCKIFAKPLKNTAVAAREVIRFIELFNFDGKKSLINYIIGNYSTTGCVFNNAKRIQSNDTLSTVPLDSLFYIDSSPYTIIQNFNEVSIKFGALEEKTPLARAEWLKFISVFYGYEREASQLFSQIEENYNCNKFLIKKQNLLASMRVVWLNRVSQNQNLWVMNDYLYKTELLKDAGAEILTIKEDNVESLHKVLKNVHFVIDDTEITDDSNAMEEFYKNYEYNDENSKRGVNFLSNKNILTNDGSRSSTGISSWKEDYLVYPHLVLADLIYWFHPKLPVSKYFKFEIEQNNYDNHYWFRNIAKNSPIHMTSNIKCPTEIPDIITQTICINLDDYDGDYSDYYAFYDIKTFLKKYILMYWYLIAFFGCFLIGLIASVHYIYKGKILRKLKNKFSNKNIHYANNENVANHNFFILEDDDFE